MYTKKRPYQNGRVAYHTERLQSKIGSYCLSPNLIFLNFPIERRQSDMHQTGSFCFITSRIS